MNLKPTIALIILSGLALALPARAQQGFVQQDIILQSGTTTGPGVTELSVTGKQTSRTYMDGLGRAIQNIAVQASPAGNDIIQPAAYDNLGRQTTGYLPYTGQSTDVMGSYRPNAISTDQPNFYNQTGQYLIATDADPYSQQVFDTSPLQRVLQAGQAGNGFQPGQHYKTVNYRYNTSTDAVWIWSNTGTHTLNNNYAANTLSVTDGTDEDGVECLIFADMAGRTILKRQIFSPANLDTYYIYDNSGMLINIVPPKATAIMAGSGIFSLSQSTIVTLIFSYAYDTRGRVYKKTVPGNVILSYIYDPLNRPVLVQDANLYANNQWNYIKYDVKGRAISQGIYTDNTNIGQSAMQIYVNGLSSNYTTAWYESRSNTQYNSGYYTNSIFPSSNITPLAYEYYDNYTLTTGTTYSYHTTGLTGEVGATTAQLKGMPTMVQKSTVGSGLTTTWLISVTFYDHNLHPIQSQTNNLLYTTGVQNAVTDYKTSVLDFTGMPTVSLTSKKTSSTVTTTVQTTLTYDPTHRITAVDQSYNGATTVHVAQYVYNELGQLVQKKLGETSTSWLQLVDFRYNIRGQLTNINNSTLTDDGHTDDDPAPVFGMTLLYDQTDSNLGNSSYHSGRLSGVKWMSKDGSNNSSYERAFTYNYDAAARYTAANYKERNGSGAFTATHGWDEQITGYDESGNIKTLTRNAATQGSGTYTAVDNLTYAYQTNNANQLYTVTDATNNQTGFGIQTGGSSGGHYVYDPNGNLTTDPYKDLTIGYNGINKTDKITMSGYTGRYEYYVYDATATVMEKQQWDNNALVHTTVYMDEFVYLDGTISYITTPEGRANYSSGAFTNEYIISDHQGNARISFNNTGTGGTREVVQENSYYGFGMVMPGSTVTGGDNKKLYNGQSEWQNDYTNMPDYYQTPGRNYDAEIGRFISADPMPESATGMSTYHYAGDNPIMMNDPTGNNTAIQPITEGQIQYGGWFGTHIFDPSQQQYEQGGAPLSQSAEANIAFGSSQFDQQESAIITQENQYIDAMAASTSIYHAGDGSDEDPTTGSLSHAINAIIGGTSSFAITAMGDGTAIITGNGGSNLSGFDVRPVGSTLANIFGRANTAWKGPMDCVFQSIAFATGRGVMDIQHEYAAFLNAKMDAKGLDPVFHISDEDVGYEGVSSDYIDEFLGNYGYGRGYHSIGDYTHSTKGDVGILLLNGSPGHAVDITGMADPSHYYYYDQQNNLMGTIATNDSSIYGVYGHH